MDDYAGALKRKGVQTLTEIARAAQSGAMVGKIAGTVSVRQERKSARGNRFAFVGLSDPTGLYEVTVFSDVLDAGRVYLEPGQNVVLTVEATSEGDTLKLLARAVQPIDAVVADAGVAGLRIHIGAAGALPSVAALLARMAEGGGAGVRAPISLCVAEPDMGQEIDITLPTPYPVTPQIKGALRAVQGVLMVEEL